MNPPINQDVENANDHRLPSRNSSLRLAQSEAEANLHITDACRDELYQRKSHTNSELPCITEQPSDFELTRKTSATLNRFRTMYTRVCPL